MEFASQHRSCSRLYTLVLGLLCLVFLSLSFSTNAFQPTPEQLNAFKQLTPGEQKRLAEQYGIAAPGESNSPGNVDQSQMTSSVQPLEVQNGNSESQVSPELGDQALSSYSDSGHGLKPFGYDLFAGNPTTFTPVTDIPVSSDYVLGPGDSLKLNLYGKENLSYELNITTQGDVYLPQLGPIMLAGQTFDEAKRQLTKTIDQKMIGVRASISMGALRSIRVFVLGEARVPGSYVVSSLSTITNALVLSGGISENGTLRNVQLKRNGELVQSFDLYDLLLNGDTSNDAQLRSGDVVFIPPVGARAGIKGEVRRPAIYELRGGESIGDLLSYAGGMKATAYPQFATIERIAAYGERYVEDVNLKLVLSKRLDNGDLINVPQVLGGYENAVRVSGHVQRERIVGWKKGLRLSDVLPDASVLKPDPDLRYGLIKRYLPPSRSLSVHMFSLEEAFAAKGSKDDPRLQPRDEIMVFGLYETGRQGRISEVIQQVRAQASLGMPSREVSVNGNVRYPGDYPLTDGMIIEQLLYAAGGLTEKAFQLQAEVSRTEFDAQQNRIQQRLNINLARPDDLKQRLRSRDVLQIKTIPNWAESASITLEGEVRFPGDYPIYKNDTLADVLVRAGGLTEYAYAPGAVFMRESLREQQAEQLAEMRQRLADDIAKAEIVAANQNQQGKDKTFGGGINEAQQLLAKLEETQALGRLVIDLERVILAEGSYAVPLQDGDRLVVPTKKNSVTVIGEVQQSISQVYEPELDYLDYIRRSGGTTDKADESRIYIVQADGGMLIPRSSNWFSSSEAQINPGDTIVVPLDADKIDQIVLWRDLSQIFYQIALGAAAVGSL